MASTTTTSPADFGPIQLPQHVGLTRWQFEHGLTGRVGEIIAAVGAEHPIGAGRCADRLGERLGRDDVHPADIDSLAAAGHLAVVDVFEKRGRSYDLYAPAAVDALPVKLVEAVIAAHAEWMAASLSAEEASELLG